MRAFVLFALLAELAAASQRAEPVTCATWQDCRQRAASSAERGDFEEFHDLAWRAVQKGPPNDPDLLYLLARAQTLSGRPGDALVMLGRLADRGFELRDLETNDDFRRVRSLPGWPQLLAKIRGTGTGEAAPAVSPPASPPPEALPVPPASPPASPPGGALHVPPAKLTPLALTYDGVSRRFVFADERSDNLKILDELSGNIVNLVNPRWGAPYRTTAIAVDPRRGDLWAVGANEDEGVWRSAIHQLQLISGRLLRTIALPDESGAARFVDVAMTDGAVLVLDGEGRRVFGLARGATALTLQMAIKSERPLTSLAAGGAVGYAADSEGIYRLNFARRTSAPLRAAKAVDLRRLEQIDWHDGSLIAIQRLANGTRAAIRIRLNRQGTVATSLEVLDTATSSAAAVVGDVYYFLGAEAASGDSVLRRHRLATKQ